MEILCLGHPGDGHFDNFRFYHRLVLYDIYLLHPDNCGFHEKPFDPRDVNSAFQLIVFCATCHILSHLVA